MQHLLNYSGKTVFRLSFSKIFGGYGDIFEYFIKYMPNASLWVLMFHFSGLGTTCLMDPEEALAPFTQCDKASGINSTVSAWSSECSCSAEYVWKCKGGSEGIQEIEVVSLNSTDRVYRLPEEISPNTWLLNTHHEFIEERYGGWKMGVRSEGSTVGTTNNTVVYFNNKVE